MFNVPLTHAIDNFSLGWDNIAKPTTMEKGSFKEIKNFNITKHGGIEKRGGMTKLYGSSAGADKITSLYEYNAPDNNAYNLAAIGTKIKAFYEAAWHDLKDGLTADKKYSFATHLGLCYGVNGVDSNFKLYNNTAYQVGITPPAAAPAVTTIPPGDDVKVEEYAETNQDNCGELRQHADRTMLAQNFTLSRDAELTKVKLSLKKIGTITAGKKVWVEIHSDRAGTQVGGDSDTQEANDIATSFTTYEFEFTGAKPDLSKNTAYYIVLYGDFTVSDTNFIVAGFDNSSPTYDSTKKYWEINGSSAWTDYPSIDLVFEIWGTQVEAESLLEYGVLDAGDDARLRKARAPVGEAYESYLLAQGFQLTSGRDITSVKLALKKFGSPAGNLWVEIHSSQDGTSKDEDDSDNQVGTKSADVDVSGISTDSIWVTFTFSGTKPSLSASTTYYLVLYCDYDEHVSNHVSWTANADTYASGKLWRIGESPYLWSAWDTSQDSDEKDASFRIYGINTSATALEQYALGNIDIIRSLMETTSQTLMAQSFQVTEESSVTRLKLWLSKVKAPVGNLWVEIHDGRDGTSGSKDTSTYKVGAGATDVDIATEFADKIFPTYGWVEFTFGGIKPSLVQGRTYYIVLYGDHSVSATDYISVGMDKVDPQYTDGVGWDVDDGSPMVWTVKDHVDLIFELYMVIGGLAGDYKYKYCYKRTAFKDLISNPSEASDLTQPNPHKMRVSLIASTDSQVDKIILYRTLDGTDPLYYKVVELPNEDQDYDDAFADGSLTTLLKEDNTVPPKSKFVIVHKDRVFYVNCPDEESGGALVRWSKSGIGEACPLSNYQYFDRDDGRDITGVASLWDNFIVFKKDKIGVLAGDLSQPSSCEISYLSLGIGCIASWAILPLEDKILFLSEEGWKATDGINIWNISSKINGLVKDGYITINENENYSIAYYPKKEQFQFLMNHSTLEPMVAVGHFIIPLILASKGIIGISEKALGSMVGWTPHQYDNHTLTCLGNYTDGDGITRVIAGSDDGYVYLLDSGAADDGSNIHVRLRTDWLSLGRPKTHTKVTRRGRLGYSTDGTISMELQEDVDFEVGGDPITFTGADRDIDDALNEPFDLAGVGELFRYTLSEISSQELNINALEIKLRDMGAR